MNCPIEESPVYMKLLGQKNGFDVYHCLGCDSVVADNQMSKSELVAFYDSYWEKPDISIEKKHEKRFHADNWASLLALFENVNHKINRHLDIGCGMGTEVKYFRSKGIDSIGIDISNKIPKEPYFFQSRIEDFPDKGFDLITAIEVIEHLREPKPFFRAVSDKLKPGGIFYFTTLTTVPECNLGTNSLLDWWYIAPPDHNVILGGEALDRLILQNNFKLIYYNHLGCLMKVA